MKNIFVLLLVIMSGLVVQGQTIEGHIYEFDEVLKTDRPLEGATVLEIGQGGDNFTLADEFGYFSLDLKGQAVSFAVHYVAYESDTIKLVPNQTYYKVYLKRKGNTLGTLDLNKSRRTLGIRTLDPKTTFMLREQEFQKAACCNLSESFENVPSIDVSFTDAVTGTKQIKMLGLASVYTTISREYMPAVRGVNTFYGLSFIPAAWVDAIQITKGAGSVVNGFESMTGQINIEMKRPFGSEQLMLDQFISESGRTETDFMIRRDITKRVSSSLFVRYAARPFAMDRNNDGFMDNPMSNQYQVMNRWQFYNTNGLEGQVNVSYNNDSKTAGQFNVDNPYEVDIDNEQIDIWAKLGKVNQEKPYKSFGSQYAYNQSKSATIYGNDSSNRMLAISGQTAYVNLMRESIFGNTNHNYKVGLSAIADDFEESLDSIEINRQELTTGLFMEYTLKPDSQWIVVAGGRVDYSTIFGVFPTLRLHVKWNSKNEKSSWRISGGNGHRTPTILAQNQNLFISSNSVILNSEGMHHRGVMQEIAWNGGLSYVRKFKLKYMPSELQMDVYRTQFQKELLVNREQQNIRFSSFSNGTIANSAQVQLDVQPARRTELRVAYRVFDVTSLYDGQRLQQLYVSKHRGFLNITQKTRSKWQFNTTVQVYGPQRTYAGRAQGEQTFGYSPTFVLLSGQASKRFKAGLEAYLGLENALNYRQKNPIIASEMPFGANFDATQIWGPVFGRMFYAGIRYRIKIKEK